ncbi:TatD family hydrolase, partial [candidate division WWE3 bacterium]|nr:TatD family hydrolase [candidate division WWE3 bacterium]
NRNADNEIVEELSRYKDTNKLRGVFHCFTSDTALARKALDLNFYISFSLILTYPSASRLEEVAKYVPRDRILIETDSPYLPPRNFKEQRNSPSCVKIVAETIAQILNMPFGEIAALTTKNAQNIFRIS